MKVRKIKKQTKRATKKRGAGLLNKIIDKLPFELHVPGYQYCGPGTHLQKRLTRGDPGINPLDTACKRHDIAYTDKNSENRSIADKVLQKEAMKRVFSKNASMGERATALAVAAAMKAKRSLAKYGAGLNKKKLKSKNKKKQVSLSSLVKGARKAIDKHRPENTNLAVKVAIAAVKQLKSKKRVKVPRIIKLPNDFGPTSTGGILPLIPIFAGLSALGAITGSAASVTNAINQARKGQQELEESKRHNGVMEAIAIGNKSGKGFYLHKKGKGFYLKPYSTKNR